MSSLKILYVLGLAAGLATLLGSFVAINPQASIWVGLIWTLFFSAFLVWGEVDGRKAPEEDALLPVCERCGKRHKPIKDSVRPKQPETRHA